LAQGLANKEIAGKLNISPPTVKNHVHLDVAQDGPQTLKAVLETWRD
jgi:FixJ family two-component response regulator